MLPCCWIIIQYYMIKAKIGIGVYLSSSSSPLIGCDDLARSLKKVVMTTRA